MFELKIVQNTIIKLQPIDSSKLTDNEKQPINAVATFKLQSYALVDNHIKFAMIEQQFQGHNTWFAYLPHVQLLNDGQPIPLVLVTQAQLSAIAPNANADRLAQLITPLNNTLQRYNIATSLRKTHFLAQTAHESDGFNTNEEYASGSDYEGREDLGNVQPGDGVKFKGRGLIQITGRTNYDACGKALGVDLIDNPSRLADFDLAALSAGWFWDKNGLNNYADQDDILTITKIINGGTNGLDDRQAYLDRAKQVFGI